MWSLYIKYIQPISCINAIELADNFMLEIVSNNYMNTLCIIPNFEKKYNTNNVYIAMSNRPYIMNGFPILTGVWWQSSTASVLHTSHP